MGAVERQTWRPVTTWDGLTAVMKRAFDVFTASDRAAQQSVSATGPLGLTWPMTLVLVTTSGGNVTLTLPAPADVPGFRVEVKKLTAANTLTLSSSANIDGAATLAWTTQYQSYRLVSDGGTWHIV